MSSSSNILEVDRLSVSTAGNSPPHSLNENPRWQLAKRVAASRRFAKSKFLSGFLLYICEKHLLDHAYEITEQQIGEHVFRRPRGYNPGDDNIVRNYARLLRQRLEEYFAGEGSAETTRIVVPRGGYIPLYIEEKQSIGAPITKQPSPSDSPVKEDSHAPSTWKLKTLCATLSIALCVLLIHDFPIRPPAPTVSDRFWKVFFTPNRDAMVVPADSGLAIYQDITLKHIHLADYASGEYQKNTQSPLGISPALANDLGGRRYTSVVDLDLVSRLSQLPVVIKSRFKVRYAREVTLDDIKQSNVILIGSLNSNPWAELFENELNFKFEYDPVVHGCIIQNQHPLSGEKARYQTDQNDPAYTTYGAIAVVPNLSDNGYVLLIQGINMAGTKAAADYLFSNAATPLLSRIFDSHGGIHPFEVLLQTGNIGANAPQPRIIAERIH
jgi:hypothetical protein